MSDIDEAFQRFEAIEPELRIALRQEQNESDTRFAVLDRLLIEVLGWQREQIKTEPPTPSGFIDYKLLLGGGRAGVIVEAKRVGNLSLKSAGRTATVLSLSGPVVKPTLAAIKQARTYALDEGAPAAVVTDGSTWVFFKPSRSDGRPFLSGRVIAYPSFDCVKEDFVRFYEMMGQQPVSERLNIVHMNKADGLVVTSTEQQYYVFDPRDGHLINRDALAVDASLLFEKFFSRLTADDTEMLNECFVETSESKKADLELQKIAERLVSDVTSIDTQTSAALQSEIERAIYTNQSETVLLVGNKGSGKSTFTTRFFDKILSASLRAQCVVARVNVEKFTGERDGILRLILIELRNQLENKIFDTEYPTYDEIQGIFWSEYKRRRDGSQKHLYESDKTQFKIEFGKWVENLRENDPENYVKAILNRSVHADKRLPVLIFDNTDQFSSGIQDQVYQLAHALGTAATTFTLVPITDRTIWRLSKDGALQSYSPKTFFLPVPEAKAIISKRVAFLKTKLQSDEKASYFSRKGFTINLTDVGMISDAIERVFIETDYVSGLIGRLGNFDIRRMLEIAKRIFMSPEIKIDEIMKSKFGGESITADSRRTHRALIKGEYDRFSELENPFLSNLFHTSTQTPSSPLLAYYILWALKGRYNSSRDDNADQRHWKMSDVFGYFEACGVQPELTLRCLQRLLDRRLVEELDPNTDHLDVSSRVGIKDAGSAHLDMTLNSSVYIEQMAMTTGINDLEVRDKIKKIVIMSSSHTFIEARDIFVNFLLKLDSARMTIPSSPEYRQLVEARNFIRAIKTSERPGSNHETVDRDVQLKGGRPKSKIFNRGKASQRQPLVPRRK